MRLADELTDHAGDGAFPAPTGLPAPTGQLPMAAQHLPHDPTEPQGPRLPPRPVRAESPPTGQQPTTPAAAAMAALLSQSVPVIDGAPAKATKKRARRRGIVVTVALLSCAATAVVFRDSRFADRITGRGYDTNPLPTHSITPPAFTGAEYTVTHQSVGIDNGLATNFWDIERDNVNFTTNSAMMTLDQAKAPIVGGTISTARSTSPTQELVVDLLAVYRPGPTAADPWTRVPFVAGTERPILSRNRVRMYQDVIDPVLRAQPATSVENEVRHGVHVTTYTYTLPFADFYESAPRLFDMVRDFDGNAADDSEVTVTVSFDGDWMVRYLDIAMDHASVLEHRADAAPGTSYPYRYTVDVLSITDAPDPIDIPNKVVDEVPAAPPAAAAP